MGKTYVEQFDEALACKDRQEAGIWLAKEIRRYWIEFNKPMTEAESIIKQNLGYMAGYYDHDTAQKINRLFDATHPIFGTASYHQELTPRDALEAGIEFAVRERGDKRGEGKI